MSGMRIEPEARARGRRWTTWTAWLPSLLLLLSVEARPFSPPRTAAAQEETSTDGREGPELVEHDGSRRAVAAARWGDADDWEFDVGGVWTPRGSATFLSWGRLTEPRRRAGLLGRSGSLLMVDRWRIAGDRLEGTTEAGCRFTALRAQVALLVLSWPPAAAERDLQLRRWRDPRPTRDQVELESGDQLTGSLLGGLAAEESSEEVDLNPGQLRLELQRGVTPLAVDAVRSIAFRGDDARGREGRSAATRWIIGLADGSILQAAKLERRDAQLRIELVDGLEWECDRGVFCESIVFIQPLSAEDGHLSRPVFASDLESAGYRHVPWLRREWSYQRDANVVEGRLRSGGRTYVKGLGMHSTSRLAFDLEGRFARLRGEMAVDDAAQQEGSVVFRIYVDRGDGKWEAALASDVLRGGDPPVKLDVDVTGVQRLALIVDAADRGDIRDYGNWLNLRLYGP